MKLVKHLKAQESRTRSQNLMANFFAKPKTEPPIPSTGHKEAADATDFDKVFKPFALRKGVEVAPTNYFCTYRRALGGVGENPILVSDDETPLPSPSAPVIRFSPASLPGVIHISLSYYIPTKPPL